MSDLEAAKRIEPSLAIIPLDTTFELFRLPSADAGRFVRILESLFSKALQYSIENPSSQSLKDASGAVASEKSSGEGYVSITRTVNEISILVDAQVGDELRRNEEWIKESRGGIVEYEGPYGCLRVRGPMPLHLTGIAANFTKTLQVAGIAVFLISTWDTDWIFVKQDKVAAAGQALEADGWVVT
ncbi:hypothetical protein NliqN6_0729 [Naganishia liquefaciens]|uniref:CASTOR ACT domain-containing protein n=1 Tax=Naganishia liquefaciens TaxID=104408 RepID=A0A8H3YDI7_9TREE|nr:hypothetical protein NliqN6_0729 [Naganishia liquefaciens]